MTCDRRKVLVIGLDGASPDLVERWTRSGDLPVLRALIERGSFNRLRSTIPPVSPAAWATFMTGREPGEHGVLGFRNLDVGRYECYEPDIISSENVAGRTFWDIAGERGIRVAAMWVPLTYPPWPVNGVLVSGYPTPSASRSFGFPESRVAGLPPLTENSAFFNSAGPERIAEELVRLALERGRVAADLLRSGEFDLAVVVIGSTDRAQHNFWRHHDPDSPVHDPAEAEQLGATILETYRAADRAVGKIVGAFSPDATVFVMSDHGGGPAPVRFFHLNAWLREKGFLAARPPGAFARRIAGAYRAMKEHIAPKEQIFRHLPRYLRRKLTAADAAATLGTRALEWAKTRAYRFPLYPPFEGIAVNLKGRQAEGAVEPTDYERLRDEIIGEILEIRDPRDGQPVVVRASRREELFSGGEIGRFPDIVIELSANYAGGSEIWGDFVSPVPEDRLRRLSGTHRMEGILIASGPGIRRGGETAQDAALADLAPTILYALGLPVPDHIEGGVLGDLFEPSYLEQNPVEAERSGGRPAKKPPKADLSAEEQAKIAEHLRNLGYMD